jgi:hypothetical protein
VLLETISQPFSKCRSVNATDASFPSKIPTGTVILAQFVCTMSTQVGVAGREVLNTERFCDTITLTTGNDDVSVDITSPTGDVIAHASVDLKGSQKLELTFAMSTGSPTSANCLIALI